MVSARRVKRRADAPATPTAVRSVTQRPLLATALFVLACLFLMVLLLYRRMTPLRPAFSDVNAAYAGARVDQDTNSSWAFQPPAALLLAIQAALHPAAAQPLPAERSEPAQEPGEPVLHFSPLHSNPPLPLGLQLSNFTGTRSLHMSSHSCAGAYGAAAGVSSNSSCTFENLFCADPYTDAYPNRTCSFHNLYYAPAEVHPPPYSSHDWFYFAAVSRAEVSRPGWDAAAARTRLKEEFRVDLLSRLKQDTWWRIEVIFFLAEPAPGGRRVNLSRPPPPLRHKGGVLSGAPPSAVVHSAEHCALLDGASSVPVYSASQWNESTALAALGLSCLPPGVRAFTPRPFFFLTLTHHTNIGHALWDDLMPFLAAAQVLQLPLTGLDLLLTAVVQEDMFRWDHALPAASWGMGDQGVRMAYAYTSPGKDPVQLSTLSAEAHRRLVHVQHVAGGLTGFSPHNFRPNHLILGAEPPLRTVWALRQHMLRQMGFSEEEAQRSVRELPPPSPKHNTSLLFIRGKRGVDNLEGLMDEIRMAYPHVQVDSVAWEETGGLLNEAKVLLTAHILVSMDGTASLKNFFLPPGAVFIELGVASSWGSQMLCDFLHGAYDHIRVLHYDQLAPGEHEGHQYSSITVPLRKLAPFLDRALALVQDGFPIPIEPGVNLDPNALLLRYLLQRYPELAHFTVVLYSQGRHLKAKRVFEGAVEWYEMALGTPPEDFREDIERFCAAQPCGQPPQQPEEHLEEVQQPSEEQQPLEEQLPPLLKP